MPTFGYFIEASGFMLGVYGISGGKQNKVG
jgi:hypothetical protein